MQSLNNKTQKENLVIMVGVSLIILVGIITFTRPYWKKTEDTEDKTNYQLAEENNKFPRLSTKELQDKIRKKQNVIILDVRSANEFETEHIVDSINIPLENLEKQKLNFNPEQEIVILASEINQAETGAALISRQGFSHILVLSGGLTAWKNNGGNTINWGDPNSFINQAKVLYISPEDAKKYLDEKRNVIFLDVRETSSFSPHIPGALNIPLNNLEKRRTEIDFGREIIVYGNTELEGFMAGVRLYDLNIYPVSVLRGGFMNWKNKNYPLEE